MSFLTKFPGYAIDTRSLGHRKDGLFFFLSRKKISSEKARLCGLQHFMLQFLSQDEAERTQNAFRGDYYLTGDRCIKDEEGYLWFVGRSDDVIISAGSVVYCFIWVCDLAKHSNTKSGSKQD